FLFSSATAITTIYTLSLHDALPICCFDAKSINCDIRYRSGNTLRFPRARDEPPHSQRTRSLWGLIVFAFPQDKESFFEIHRTQKKRFSFSRSLRVFPSLVLCCANSSQLFIA